MYNFGKAFLKYVVFDKKINGFFGRMFSHIYRTRNVFHQNELFDEEKDRISNKTFLKYFPYERFCSIMTSLMIS